MGDSGLYCERNAAVEGAWRALEGCRGRYKSYNNAVGLASNTLCLRMLCLGQAPKSMEDVGGLSKYKNDATFELWSHAGNNQWGLGYNDEQDAISGNSAADLGHHLV